MTDSMDDPFDILVIGGGINGAGIAADAALRGFSVALVEQADLASGTSSASSKLIHGGLRYLEYGEFRLVRKALKERARLLSLAPHLIKPLRFRLPHEPHLRAAPLIRLGLFLYDHLAMRGSLPGSTGVDLAAEESFLKSEFKRGFDYSDAWVDDARLVVLNAIAAREAGASIMTRTMATGARRQGKHWHLAVRDLETGAEGTLRGRALVNATGPWLGQVSDRIEGSAPTTVRLVAGSHIIVPRFASSEHAYILQHADGRIVFAIPYLDRFTLVGTTDRAYSGDPAAVSASEAEISYLLDIIAHYFREAPKRADVVATYAGVRPLIGDEGTPAAALSRDYSLRLEGEKGEPPLLTILGGKITTYRVLAEEAVDKLSEAVNDRRRGRTATTPLPGGDIGSFEEGVAAIAAKYPWVADATVERLVHAYGSRADAVLNGAEGPTGLGTHFGADLYEAEVCHLIKSEWAKSTDDILWRRTKLGLSLSDTEVATLKGWIDAFRKRPGS